MTGVIQINWSNPNVRLWKSARNCQITASNELSGDCHSHDTLPAKADTDVAADGDADVLGRVDCGWKICMCHASVRVWHPAGSTSTTGKFRMGWALRVYGYMCVKRYSFRLNDWTNEWLTNGRMSVRTDAGWPHPHSHIHNHMHIEGEVLQLELEREQPPRAPGQMFAVTTGASLLRGSKRDEALKKIYV